MDYPIENIFTYHAPKGTQSTRYEAIRAEAKKLAWTVYNSCPSTRERNKALELIEAAVMWANAAIARNE